MIQLNFKDDLVVKKIESWIIFILILLNILLFIFISNRLYFRFDLTEGQRYSISPPTKNLLKKLDNTLVIEYFYNNKCKEIKEMAQVVQYIEDILKEYENAGNGLVNIVIKELSYEKANDLALISELEQKGIKPFALSEGGTTESKELLGFSGIIVSYKENSKVISPIFNDQGFEFRLDVEIQKLLGGGEDVLGIIFACDGLSFEKNYSYVNQICENEFSNIKIISSGENIPNDVTTLLIIGGDNLTDYDIFQIDQFLVNGGKAFIALSGIQVIIQEYGLFGMPADSRLFDLLKFYGIQVTKDLVGDNESYRPVIQGFSKARYPLWIKVKNKNFNKKSPIVNEIESLKILWASSVKVDDRVKQYGDILFSTTNSAWAQVSDFKLDLESYKYPVQEGGNQYHLALTYKGPIDSFFADKEVPKNLSGKDSFTGNKVTKGNTQLVVVGSEFFLNNDFAGNEEFLFLMNSLDWLAKDSSLIAIRNKGKFSKPLDKAKDSQQYEFLKNFIIGFTTYFLPVVFVIIAIILFIIKKNRDKKIKDYFIAKKRSNT
ncbi:MAG TPA: GldG family protein [Spirochaetota bacterium]|nr:GldG family protein [Spirochaetota bacterium]HOL56262.1 GldG family protein [Spirochaetota bacterium]HPP04396.1 GldG family protein [Spirochaetota bacterium]